MSIVNIMKMAMLSLLIGVFAMPEAEAWGFSRKKSNAGIIKKESFFSRVNKKARSAGEAMSRGAKRAAEFAREKAVIAKNRMIIAKERAQKKWREGAAGRARMKERAREGMIRAREGIGRAGAAMKRGAIVAKEKMIIAKERAQEKWREGAAGRARMKERAREGMIRAREGIGRAGVAMKRGAVNMASRAEDATRRGIEIAREKSAIAKRKWAEGRERRAEMAASARAGLGRAGAAAYRGARAAGRGLASGARAAGRGASALYNKARGNPVAEQLMERAEVAAEERAMEVASPYVGEMGGEGQIDPQTGVPFSEEGPAGGFGQQQFGGEGPIDPNTGVPFSEEGYGAIAA